MTQEQLTITTRKKLLKILVNFVLAVAVTFYGIVTRSLKPLWDSSFTFLTSSIICDVEKVFAKKPGFLPDKENRVLNFG